MKNENGIKMVLDKSDALLVNKVLQKFIQDFFSNYVALHKKRYAWTLRV